MTSVDSLPPAHDLSASSAALAVVEQTALFYEKKSQAARRGRAFIKSAASEHFAASAVGRVPRSGPSRVFDDDDDDDDDDENTCNDVLDVSERECDVVLAEGVAGHDTMTPMVHRESTSSSRSGTDTLLADRKETARMVAVSNNRYIREHGDTLKPDDVLPSGDTAGEYALRRYYEHIMAQLRQRKNRNARAGRKRKDSVASS